MALIKKILKLFREAAEEAPRMVIITKDPNKDEIERFEKEIKNKKNEEELPGENRTFSPKSPDRAEEES